MSSSLCTELGTSIDCKTVGRDRRREAPKFRAARKTDCRLSIQRIRSVHGSGDGLDNAAKVSNNVGELSNIY